LRKHFARIVAPELLGHGRSHVPAAGLSEETLRAGLEETLDALLPPGEDTLLLGTSLGGAAAIRYAGARPERVRALVLVSPAGAPLSHEELDSLRAKFDVKTRADARRFFGELLHRPPWYAELAAPMLVELLGNGTVRDFLDGVRPDQLLRADELAALSMPVLVVWGRSDRLLPRSSLEFFRDALPKHARVEEPDGLGHSPHLEAPDWVASRVASFAREVWG
jgi:pimeloyl-ACP methyl ester carboxylesterase